MPFKKYIHLERFNTEEVEGIECGVCHIFPKLDGSNGSIWFDDGFLRLGSRNRVLSDARDNQGFLKAILSSDAKEKFEDLFARNPNWNVYGEWMVPHTIKSYREETWNKFWIFDVWDGERFLHYDEYINVISPYGLNIIPPLRVIDTPSEEQLYALMNTNTFMLRDNEGAGEGIVIKRYGFKNEYDRTVWAKLVRNEFKDLNKQVFDGNKVVQGSRIVEKEIVDKYITQAFVDKELAKLKAMDLPRKQLIPRFLQTCWYELIKEESYNFVKEFKSPTIDFKRLHRHCTHRVKLLCKELF